MLSPSDKNKIEAIGDVAAMRHKLDKRQRAVMSLWQESSKPGD